MEQNKKWLTDFFVLRTPLKPLDQLEQMFGSLRTGNPDDMLQMLDAHVLEGIYLASPALYDELQRYLQEPAKFTPDKVSKMSRAIFKYLNRASGRCTPFGLFANCTVGRVTADMEMLEIPREGLMKHLRLDMDFLCDLANRMKAVPELRRHLVYYPNSAIYNLKGNTKYIEYKYGGQGNRSFHLSRIKPNTVMREILRLAANGLEYGSICDGIIQLYDFERQDVEGYLDTLIGNNVLYSNIEPNVTGEAFFDRLYRVVEKIGGIEPAVAPLLEKLNAVTVCIRDIRSGEGGVETYKELFEILKKLSHDGIVESRLFQMDTSKSSPSLAIGKTDVDQMIGVIETMAALHQQEENPNLKKFRKAFVEKYEEQTVPLMELFDNETGLGYKNARSLSDHFDTTQQRRTTAQEYLAFKKYMEFVRSGAGEIVLTEGDLRQYEGGHSRLPDAFSVMLNVLETEGRTMFSVNSVSLSTTNLLGRFCHADGVLNNHVRELVRREETDTHVLAEIAHLPQSRIGNILSRPVLTDYEIEFLSLSTLPADKKIRLEDLYVKVDRGEVVLYSRKLKKRVIPKLSSAHNYASGSLDIYHFLCDLQYQHTGYIQLWNWGALLQQEPFLPRVSFRNCVLSPAQWKADLLPLREAMTARKITFREAMQEWRLKNGMPDQVLLKRNDNYIVLDLSTEFCMEVLQKETKDERIVYLTEFIFQGGANSPVKDTSGGRYANEIIIPVNRVTPLRTVNAINPRWMQQVKSKREFFLGDEWLYIKVYGKTKNFNSILLQLISAIQRMMEEGSITSWFFIRYSDPFPHLRIRFRVKKPVGGIVEEVHKQLKKLIAQRIVTDIISNTYVRELERYGDQGMEASEDMFCQSSALVGRVLKARSKGGQPIHMHQLALCVIDRMADAFGLDLESKARFYKGSFTSFSKEFNYLNDKNMKKTFQTQFRQIRPMMEVLTNGSGSPYENLGLELYIRNVKRALGNMDAASASLETFLGSHIHMFVNRMFAGNQRFEEFVLYYFLDNYYRSYIAVQKLSV